MTNEEIDALVRRVEVAALPDASFVASSLSTLEVRVRAARRRDTSRLGRLRRPPSLAMAPAMAMSRSVRVAGLVALLILALVAGLVVVGALNRPTPLGSGPLIVSIKGQLEAIDPVGGSARPILPSGVMAEGVSRSPDGRLATFWINEPGRSQLFAVGVDGEDRRELGSGLAVTWSPSIDTWSPDSRFLATEVTLGGTSRILIVDSKQGTARLLTPPSVAAHNPLWSPDGQTVVFSRDASTGHTLSVINADGSLMHDLSGLMGLDVNGPDTWSPDGRWIYFGAGDTSGQHAFRVNLAKRFREQLSAAGQSSPAVASSPDGTMILFNVDAGYGFDLWIADSDGTAAHRLLRSGGIGSWSVDGQLVLVRWRPVDKDGGLATIKPDGTGLTIVMPFDPSCRKGWVETCELGYGWGGARP